MAHLRALHSMDEFQTFKRRVYSYVHHSAYRRIIDTIFSCLIDVRDPGTDILGGLLTASFRAGGTPYTLSYSRRTFSITLRRGGQTGRIVHTFGSESTAADIRRVFEAIRPTLACRFHPHSSLQLD